MWVCVCANINALPFCAFALGSKELIKFSLCIQMIILVSTYTYIHTLHMQTYLLLRNERMRKLFECRIRNQLRHSGIVKVKYELAFRGQTFFLNECCSRKKKFESFELLLQYCRIFAFIFQHFWRDVQ